MLDRVYRAVAWQRVDQILWRNDVRYGADSSGSGCVTEMGCDHGEQTSGNERQRLYFQNYWVFGLFPSSVGTLRKSWTSDWD
jgi:hypothetical protein